MNLKKDLLINRIGEKIVAFSDERRSNCRVIEKLAELVFREMSEYRVEGIDGGGGERISNCHVIEKLAENEQISGGGDGRLCRRERKELSRDRKAFTLTLSRRANILVSLPSLKLLQFNV